MSISKNFDLTRSSIVENYRKRIQAGERTKLTRSERETLTLILLDRLIELNQSEKDNIEEIQQLCEAEKALLEEGFPQSSINSVYLPNYTRVIKEAIANGRLSLNDQNSYPKKWTKRDGSESGTTQTHYALEFLTYDSATQNQLRSKTTANNNSRQDNLKKVRLYTYLQSVQELLSSHEPEILTIAIAAVSGRRHTEVVSVGEFSPTVHPYLIHFQGQQKKLDSIAYEILSLIPAVELLKVIERYRAMSQIQALSGLDDTDPKVEAFNMRVNRRVQALFGDTGLVPVLEGFKTVSIHRLRALYGAVAIHFFCPNHQHLHRFLQNYLGHVLDKDISSPNSRATDHYFHYYLVDDDGTPITTRGVKLVLDTPLPESPKAVPIASVEKAAQPLSDSVSPTQSSDTSVQIYASQYSRLCAVLNAICPNQPSVLEQMSELLNWVESHLAQTATQTNQSDTKADCIDEQQHKPSTASIYPESVQPMIDLSRTLALLTEEVLSLRQQVNELRTQNNQTAQFQTLESELTHLRAENSRLKQAQTSLLQAYNDLLRNNGDSHHHQLSIGVTTTTSPPEIPAPPMKLGNAQQRAWQIFQAVKQWNQLHPEQSFALTKGLFEREFGVHREAVQQFLTTFHDDIQQHHQQIGVSNERSHNRQIGRNIEQLKAFVHNILNC